MSAGASARDHAPEGLQGNCFSKRLLFSSERLSHHYRVQHSRDRVCGDEDMKRGKYVLRKLKSEQHHNSVLKDTRTN